ncbi:hypothetical protein VTO42DRAFT_4733 [Malbranchea cinnamomea]
MKLAGIPQNLARRAADFILSTPDGTTGASLRRQPCHNSPPPMPWKTSSYEQGVCPQRSRGDTGLGCSSLLSSFPVESCVEQRQYLCRHNPWSHVSFLHSCARKSLLGLEGRNGSRSNTEYLLLSQNPSRCCLIVISRALAQVRHTTNFWQK